MKSRIISVSAAPYDGYDFPRVLDSLAAFIVDYTEPFDESAFTAEQARQLIDRAADPRARPELHDAADRLGLHLRP